MLLYKITMERTQCLELESNWTLGTQWLTIERIRNMVKRGIAVLIQESREAKNDSDWITWAD